MTEHLRRWLQGRVWMRPRYDVLGRSFLVIVCVRAVLAVYTVIHHAVVLGLEVSTWPLVGVNVVIIAWTVFISWFLASSRGRTPWVCVADVAVTVAVMVVSPLVATVEQAPLTLAGYWMLGAPLYAAVLLSTTHGIVAALAVAAVFVAVTLPGGVTWDWHVLMVLLLSTTAVGELMGQFKTTIREQERERTRSAALAERERLARIVHDGALQVLALVEREAPSLGPRGARLAAMARESESQLRNLLRDREIVGEDSTLVDLAAALDKYQSARVTVSTMAGQVMVPRHVVDEVEATLVETLKNVEKHAGEDAQAWVLLDQEHDDEVILWVRDNGVGVSAQQVNEAAARGRMGIKDSIVGRMRAIGGSAILKSNRGSGTEWELRFPVEGFDND